MATEINTYCPGFKFTDADHPITKNEYAIMMNEIQDGLNQLHSTDTITVDGDSSTEGGFNIKDSKWPNNFYKTMRHNFQSIDYNKSKRISDIGQHCAKNEWLGDQTILPCFRHEITFKEKYGFEENDKFICSPYINWDDLTEKQLVVKRERIEKLKKKLVTFDEKENKKMRHNTYLKSFYGAPAWTNAELNVFRNIFQKHGILTTKSPNKLT